MSHCPLPRERTSRINPTLEEKIHLLKGSGVASAMGNVKPGGIPGAVGTIVPTPRLGIPTIYLSDGPAGLRIQPTRTGEDRTFYCTAFPIATLLASSWNEDLLYEVGDAMGKEAEAYGIDVILGPGANIHRHPLCGRNFEYFSEDPILSGEMGAAYINGVQSQGVGSILKHFTANNVETMRMFNNSNVDTRTLHELYLTPFEIAVKKSQPWTVMACYNRVQGEYGTQSEFLLTDILKKDWGFKGIVVSDWFAVIDRVAAMKAGMHLEMPNVSPVNNAIAVEAIKNGELDIAVVDALVKEILTVVFKAKSLQKEGFELNIEKDHAFARKVASEAATLLKNDNDVLPISKDKYKKAAIIGGGDGGVARECISKNFSFVDWYELDPEVVDVCNKHLGDIGNKSTEKNSVKCVWGDAFESIKSIEDDTYDHIFVDLNDDQLRQLVWQVCSDRHL